MNAIEVLRSVPLLTDLDAEEIDNLAALAETFTLEPGARLFEEGDPAKAIFVIATGRVQTRKRLPGEREVTASEQGPGAVFGEMALIAGLPRIAGVRAVEPTTGLVLDARVVRGLMSRPGTRALGWRLAAEALALLRQLVERWRSRSTPTGMWTTRRSVRALRRRRWRRSIPSRARPSTCRRCCSWASSTDLSSSGCSGACGGCRPRAGPRWSPRAIGPTALLIVLRGAVESTGAGWRRRAASGSRPGPGRHPPGGAGRGPPGVVGVLSGAREGSRWFFLPDPTACISRRSWPAGKDMAARRLFQGLYRNWWSVRELRSSAATGRCRGWRRRGPSA